MFHDLNGILNVIVNPRIRNLITSEFSGETHRRCVVYQICGVLDYFHYKSVKRCPNRTKIGFIFRFENVVVQGRGETGVATMSDAGTAARADHIREVERTGRVVR